MTQTRIPSERIIVSMIIFPESKKIPSTQDKWLIRLKNTSPNEKFMGSMCTAIMYPLELGCLLRIQIQLKLKTSNQTKEHCTCYCNHNRGTFSYRVIYYSTRAARFAHNSSFKLFNCLGDTHMLAIYISFQYRFSPGFWQYQSLYKTSVIYLYVQLLNPSERRPFALC